MNIKAQTGYLKRKKLLHHSPKGNKVDQPIHGDVVVLRNINKGQDELPKPKGRKMPKHFLKGSEVVVDRGVVILGNVDKG